MKTLLENSQQQAITIRVVFDGAPFAGKTTAAYSLGQVLGGTPVTPAEEDGRTVWFDWLTYSGGHHEGRDIRVELVTVPGQARLASRRRHLLSWGDVVVFVADTGKSSFAKSVAMYTELVSDVEIRHDLPIVVIANKRDLVDAVPIDEVRSQLGLKDKDILVEVVATSGGGLREAFIFAVRAALASSANRLEETTADDLLEQMQASLDAVLESAEASDSDVDNETDELPLRTPHNQTGETNELPVRTPHNQTGETNELPLRAPHNDHEASAVDGDVAPALAGPTQTLRGAHLNPDALADDAAIVILAKHWRFLVDVANGKNELPLDDGTPEAELAAELSSWGLIASGAPDAVAGEIADDSYREMRTIRRSLSG